MTAPTDDVLYEGQPASVPWFVAADLFIVPFTFLWAGFAVVAAVNGAREEPSSLPFALLFVAVGAYISVGRLLVRRRQWRRTRYRVTSSKVEVTSGRSKETAYLDQLPPPTRTGRGRAGHVGFGSTAGVHGALAFEGWPGAGMVGGWPFGSKHPVLVGVADADGLVEVIEDAQRQGRRRH